jgi:DNA ligase-associated metallophosphoesterase
MMSAPLHFAGEMLMLDPAGALVWPAAHALVVADLHLEKGSSYAAGGRLLPPWDTKVTLDRLALLLRRHRPRQVIALGDSFHDTGGASRMLPGERARLNAMAGAIEFVWVMGNHDPCPSDVGGVCVAEYQLGPLLFRHQAQRGSTSEVSGHFHPKACVPARGTAVTRPCFVTDKARIMLPAFGAYTGGLDVRDPAIHALFPRGGRVFLLGRERLFSFSL